MSGRINGTVSRNNAWFDFFIDWDVINSNADRIANNRSQVRASCYIRTTSTTHTFDTVVSRGHTLNIDGVQHAWSQRIDCSPFGSNPRLIESFTRFVEHNANGTKSLNISSYVNAHASSYGPSNCHASATVTLNTILQDKDADADPASLTATAYNAQAVSGIGANAECAVATVDSPDNTSTPSPVPETAELRALAFDPVAQENDEVVGVPPSVRAVERGVQSNVARTVFPCEIPGAAQPGDIMLYVLHYQDSYSSVTALPPTGTWAERIRGDVNDDHAMWVWERQVQDGEAGTSIEATLSAVSIGVASIIVLRDARYVATSGLRKRE